MNDEIFEIYHKGDERVKNEFATNVKPRLIVKTEYEKNEYDYSWLEKMEETMRYLENIISNPKRFIQNEEEVVKIEKARKVTVESVRHLTQHTNNIQDYDPKTGDVMPSKILNINKEETFEMYENRFIYTLFQNMKMFISTKERASTKGSSVKSNKSIQYKSQTKVGHENVDISLNVNTSRYESGDEAGGETVDQRITKIKNQITDMCASELMVALAKGHSAPVRSPIRRTNVILKNPNFAKALELWEFMERYKESDTQESDSKDYEDEGELREHLDSAFLLDYLVIENALSKRCKELLPGENKFYLNKIIKDFIENNDDYDEESFKRLLNNEFKSVLREKNNRLAVIRRIFKREINKLERSNRDALELLK